MSTQNCSNCYNGCTEITSDKCVKYTGVDVPILGIKNGDSLSYVEQALITFLGSTLDGTGIQPVVPPSDICPVVQANLEECSPLSLNNYLTGIIKTICDLAEEVSDLGGSIGSAPYNVQCIGSVNDDTDTREVLQQTINKLCEVEQSLNQFITDVTNNYVQIVDINTYIENYLNTNPSQQLVSNRMVPFAAMPYYGTLNNFDASGAGIGIWANIYLCNGLNGTPDLRGRIPVGATDGMGGNSLPDQTNPALSGNPTYNLGSVVGANSVTLTTAQIPSHSHADTAQTIISPSEHQHYTLSLGDASETNPPTSSNQVQTSNTSSAFLGYAMRGTSSSATVGKTSSVTISGTTTITASPTGGDQPHINYQPGYGSYYIIYIP
tara:strand:- start:167 stop:1303 length:1137 start_codon:yes stop_codon:yes gene_type:complete